MKGFDKPRLQAVTSMLHSWKNPNCGQGTRIRLWRIAYGGIRPTARRLF